MEFKLSPSTISKYTTCPFYFFCKITYKPSDPYIETSYGDAGNAVHHTIEYYYKHMDDIPVESALVELESVFLSEWEKFDIQNASLDKETYWKAVVNSINLKKVPTDFEIEFKLNKDFEIWKEGEFLAFNGYADLINTKEHWIGDWKTSTYKKSKLEEYKVQLKYYSYCYWKKYGHIPYCFVYFNKKDNKYFEFSFTQQELEKLKAELLSLSNEIQKKFAFNEFERNPSNHNCFFCPHKNFCATDFMREKKSELFEVTFHLIKHKLLIEATMPEELHKAIEKKINYQVKNAFFRIKMMASKGVKYDGIKRLYFRREYGAETTQGYINTVMKEFKTFCENNNKKLSLKLIDKRESRYLENKITVPEKLNFEHEFYDFQNEAVETLLKYRWGICEVGTGGGKTAISAELIRRIGCRTIFIIDNKDLLMQTKKEYEVMLNKEVGIVGLGKREWYPDIIVSTIQTLGENIKEFAEHLKTFSVAIFDEAHQSGADSYVKISKALENTKYRFGFSATPRGRGDGDDNIIYANTGEVVYVKKALDLVKEGVLVRPKAIFINYSDQDFSIGEYHDAYINGIVKNDLRNNAILKKVEQLRKEKKQVMVLIKDIKNGHAQFFKDNISNSELIYGQTEDDIRFDLIEKYKRGEFDVLVGNIRIFNKGLNIPNLDAVINAAANGYEITTIQTIGRALRLHEGKEEGLYIDFNDHGPYLQEHSTTRKRALINEGYEVLEENIK